ncbi:hypothetical protein AnigIFM60653_009922 [Aspergillus niger]|nr:hypothetical protein AnigIFM60653_009922 [Aspergillus niger]
MYIKAAIIVITFCGLCAPASATNSTIDIFPPPPEPEPIEVVELPLPPVAPNNDVGSCTPQVNPRRTGCIGVSPALSGGSFLPSGNHVVATVNFTGAPAAPDPASIYTGMQMILVSTNGTAFPNGDLWKCITCGTPGANKVGTTLLKEYPQTFKDGQRVMAADNIVDCSPAQLNSPQCTPDKVRIYPIRWNTEPDGSGPGGAIRELRIHPDNVHIGFSSFAIQDTVLGQFAYIGRLQFNPSPTTGAPLTARYDVVNVTKLFNPNSPQPISVNGSQLFINASAISIGELRGFTGSGKEVLYVGYPAESSNIDIFAADLTTGAVRRITQHPEYVDPIDVSTDDRWAVILDTRGTNRQMWLSGMRGIPPITDLITTSLTSATRNNGQRRFFEPWLLDHAGDRGTYFGQKINEAGDGKPGSINDPNWNALADPRWSSDATKIMYYQRLVVPPACGGVNSLPCPNSTAQGGRIDRLMLATLTSRNRTSPQPVVPVPEIIPWGVAYTPGDSLPIRPKPPAGKYVLMGKARGTADVTIVGNRNAIQTIAVKYNAFSDDGINTLFGTENVTVASSYSVSRADWFSNITSVGATYSTKQTSKDGFHLEIDVLTNIFNANGTLTTTIDGNAYEQPANGT